MVLAPVMVLTKPPSVKLFRSYLRAGTQWPQVRGVLALAILREIFSEASSGAYNSPLTDRLADVCITTAASELSENQLNTAFRSANILHRRAGIKVAEERLRASLPFEWRRSVGAALYSLLWAVSGDRPHQVVDASSPELLCMDDKLAHLVSYLHQAAPETTRSIELIERLTTTAAVHFLEKEKLARVYQASFFGSDERHALLAQRRGEYEDILSQNGLPGHTLYAPKECRARILLSLVTTMEASLNSELALCRNEMNLGDSAALILPVADFFPFDWVSWGFYETGTGDTLHCISGTTPTLH